jgi:hypothetical protein
VSFLTDPLDLAVGEMFLLRIRGQTGERQTTPGYSACPHHNLDPARSALVSFGINRNSRLRFPYITDEAYAPCVTQSMVLADGAVSIPDQVRQ